MTKKTLYRQKAKSKKPRFSRFCRYWYIKLLRLQGHPREIARGLAVGVFAGSFPWLGVQIIIAVFLAIIFKGNKIAAATATWISNPFTYVPFFAFNYKVGEFILGTNSETGNLPTSSQVWESWSSVMELGSDFLFTMFFGCLIVGIILSFFTYFLSLRLLNNRRQRRIKSHTN